MNFLNLNSQSCVTISFNIFIKTCIFFLQHKNRLHRAPWFEQSVEQFAAIGWVLVKYLSVNTWPPVYLSGTNKHVEKVLFIPLMPLKHNTILMVLKSRLFSINYFYFYGISIVVVVFVVAVH